METQKQQWDGKTCQKCGHVNSPAKRHRRFYVTSELAICGTCVPKVGGRCGK